MGMLAIAAYPRVHRKLLRYRSHRVAEDTTAQTVQPVKLTPLAD